MQTIGRFSQKARPIGRSPVFECFGTFIRTGNVFARVGRDFKPRDGGSKLSSVLIPIPQNIVGRGIHHLQSPEKGPVGVVGASCRFYVVHSVFGVGYGHDRESGLNGVPLG